MMVQSHILSVPLAVKYGSRESLFLSNICWWIEKNRANGRHLHEGRYWTYNTVAGFTELFPYFTANQIQHLIGKLREKNILLVGNFNKIGYDRTNWYSVSDEVMAVYLGKTAAGEDSPGEDAATLAGLPPEPGGHPILPNGNMHPGKVMNPLGRTGKNRPETPPGRPRSADTGGPGTPRPAPETASPEPGGHPILPNGNMHPGKVMNPFDQTGTWIHENSRIDWGLFPDRFGKTHEPIPANKPVYKPAAAASEKTEKHPSPAGPPETAAAALQKEFHKIDPLLVFDEAFYPRAAAFLQTHALDRRYPAWLYKECRGRNPGSLRGLYYNLFFKPDILALFLETKKKTEPAPAVTVTCPVCGREHEKKERCPECGLPPEDRADKEAVNRQKRFYTLSPEDKRTYETELHGIITEYTKPGLMHELFRKRRELEEKYGLLIQSGTG
jgi:ribosomal protein L37E